MNAVELVRQICKDRKISIAKLERDCDFSNGYISKMKKEHFPVDKAQKISEYLGIDINALIGIEDVLANNSDGVYYVNQETAEIAKAVYENHELRVLFNAAKDSKPEDVMMAADMLKRFKETNPDG